jgi:hypothetical protein
MGGEANSRKASIVPAGPRCDGINGTTTLTTLVTLEASEARSRNNAPPLSCHPNPY